MCNCIEKDVTNIAKQLVELVKATGQNYSLAHTLEVYRGSLSQYIKKYKHERLSLHGAGKHLAKGEASRILRYLVIEDFLREDVKKSDVYGSVSSVLRARKLIFLKFYLRVPFVASIWVNESKAKTLLFGGQKIILRFPVPGKAVKMGRADSTPAKGTLPMGQTSPLQNGTPAQPQNEADLNLSAKLFASLRLLRTLLVKEAGEGVMAYHIFGNATLHLMSKKVPRTKDELLDVNGIGKAKITKYGDRILETIEATIREHQKTCKSGGSGSSNENGDATKRRRGAGAISESNAESANDFTEVIGQKSKRRITKLGARIKSNNLSYDEPRIDVELDFDDFDQENVESNTKANVNNDGRVLPQWSHSGSKVRSSASPVFDEYAYKG